MRGDLIMFDAALDCRISLGGERVRLGFPRDREIERRLGDYAADDPACARTCAEHHHFVVWPVTPWLLAAPFNKLAGESPSLRVSDSHDFVVCAMSRLSTIPSKGLAGRQMEGWGGKEPLTAALEIA